MFLDENGNIKVVAYIGSVSGASGYEHILSTWNVIKQAELLAKNISNLKIEEKLF